MSAMLWQESQSHASTRRGEGLVHAHSSCTQRQANRAAIFLNNFRLPILIQIAPKMYQIEDALADFHLDPTQPFQEVSTLGIDHSI
jgi:hypothetical protein